MSNYACPPQLVEDVPYRDLDEMHAFAGRWRADHRGRWFTVAKLSGFCLLMTRTVYDAIGGLDERFGLGLFDDDDLAERARRAGFELAVTRDCLRPPLRQPDVRREWDRCRAGCSRRTRGVRREVGAGCARGQAGALRVRGLSAAARGGGRSKIQDSRFKRA